ncbi:MAG: Ig-like domain-containing protein [Tannerella sp.]|jgi:hypothetical protein|nr:Ig-like domain-containing protein [Tannerella sp.]
MILLNYISDRNPCSGSNPCSGFKPCKRFLLPNPCSGFKPCKRFLLHYLTLLIISACANIGNPNGGPPDYDPPKYISSKPAVNQLNFNGKTIEITFDEFISVDNPSENVIITPPQKQNPYIQALGKKVRVELKDTLKENTTYTLDFTSSISDNNEKNVLENYSFAFSTGETLDTMQISGTLLQASDLEPVSKILVGIHSDLSDTAFVKTPFLRTSKTNEYGQFVIHNVTPGTYAVFALDDKNRNYAYDKANDESLAFLDTLVVTSCERKFVPDSVFRDTVINKIDTVVFDSIAMVEKTIFYPNDLILWYFNDSITPRQRILRPERPQDYIFTLKFNAPLDTLPEIMPLNFAAPDSMWYVTQKADDPESFAINYWLLDSSIYKIDTLMIAVTYLKNNDSIPDLLELQTDTFSLVNKETQMKKKEKKPKKKPKIRKTTPKDSLSVDSVPPPPPPIPLQMDIKPSGALNPYDIITIVFGEPVTDVRKEFFKMEIGVDTLFEAVEFDFEEDTLHAMTYLVKRQWKYNEKYRLTVDSASLRGVYGHYNDLTTVSFTVKDEKEYGHLSIAVTGLPMMLSVQDSLTTEPTNNQTVTPAFIELLNSTGTVVRTARVENGVAVFRDMPAEKYYAKIIFDTNGNGKWDAGNYEERRQPEKVVYCMTQFEIRTNWKIEESWDVGKSKPDEKPLELLKNKPKEDKKKNRNWREESKQRGGGGSMGGGFGGLGGLTGGRF